MTNGSAMSGFEVLVMAYGGPDCLDAVGPFMECLIGRPSSADVIARVTSRYAAIGGCSPLPAITDDFVTSIALELGHRGAAIPVVAGFKYTEPSIGTALNGMYARGVRHVAAVSLSPFESNSTSTAYQAAVSDALADMPDMHVDFIEAIGDMPVFVELHREALSSALERVSDVDAHEILTVFTAHSLPESDLETPERYVSGLRRVSGEIAADLGFEDGADFSASPRLPGIASYGSPDAARPWILAYQSKGMRPGAWLGPDLEDVMTLAVECGFRAIVVSPIGFATEHMETAYDLDIVEAGHARELGIEFERGQAPNDEPRLVSALSSAVLKVADRA